MKSTNKKIPLIGDKTQNVMYYIETETKNIYSSPNLLQNQSSMQKKRKNSTMNILMGVMAITGGAYIRWQWLSHNNNQLNKFFIIYYLIMSIILFYFSEKYMSKISIAEGKAPYTVVQMNQNERLDLFNKALAKIAKPAIVIIFVSLIFFLSFLLSVYLGWVATTPEPFNLFMFIITGLLYPILIASAKQMYRQIHLLKKLVKEEKNEHC